MTGRIFATLQRIDGKDVVQNVQIAYWRDDTSYQERHAVLLEMKCQDIVALWEALESIVENDARFAWTLEYPGVKEILERRARKEAFKGFLTFGTQTLG